MTCCYIRLIAPLTILAALTSAFHATSAVAQQKVLPSKESVAQLIGTWKLEKADHPGNPSGIGNRLKMFTGTHWSIVQADPKTGEIIFLHGGTYKFDGSTMLEKVAFAGKSTLKFVGNTSTLKLIIDGDTLKQSNADGSDETWRRINISDFE